MKNNNNPMNVGITRRRFVSATISGAAAFAVGRSARSDSRDGQEETPSTRALTLSWGTWWHTWARDRAFEALLALYTRCVGVVDEVWFYDLPGTNWHPPLDAYSETTRLIAERFRALREIGVPRVGVHATTTIGHHDGLMAGAPPLPVPGMVGADGAMARGSACPNRPEFHAYIAGKYRALARSAPDFIIVADDLRMAAHTPVTWGCFCEYCLADFGKSVTRVFDRPSLVSALNEPGDPPLRQAWIARNARALEAVYSTIGQAVQTVDPALQLGAETLGTNFSSYSNSAYERWFAALRGTRSRSGGGFYWDSSVGTGLSKAPSPFDGDRMGLLVKAWDTARQTESYPSQVYDRRYELETHPDGCLGKESQTIINEIAVTLVAAGCNGADIRTLGAGPSYEEYIPLFKRLMAARSYFQKVLQHCAGLPAAGLWAAWSPQLPAKRTVRSGETWLSESIFPELPYDLNLPILLTQLGLPLVMRHADCGVVLAGRIVEALPDDVVRAILRGGVLMDAAALQVLSERGFADLLGVRIGTTNPDHSTLHLTADPLNGPYKDSVIPYFQSMSADFTHVTLVSMAHGVRWLASLSDQAGEAKAGPCMAAYENSAGGRIVVSGVSPWWFLNYASRRYQLLEIADWISRSRVPVRIEEPVPLTPYVRMNDERTRGVILLFNTGLTPVDSASVSIRAPRDIRIRLCCADKSSEMKRFEESSGWGVRIQHIPAWSTVSLLLG